MENRGSMKVKVNAAIIDFRPSPEDQQRIEDLIAREKDGSLPPEDQRELDHFVELEHILRMAKAKAREILAQRSELGA